MGSLSQLAKGNSKKVCPLCSSNNGNYYYKDRLREYYQCKECDLVYVPKQYWLSTEAEKKRYDQHENNIEDPKYRQFLGRIVDPLLQNISSNKAVNEIKGLDFGCGPGPALASMLAEMGYNIVVYDKFYQPNADVLQNKYDFITSTEVVEHLQQPSEVLEELWQMLKANGVLAIMTKRVIDLDAFKHWHYKNDDTHIVFFSKNTFDFLAKKWASKAQYYGDDVVIFSKPSEG